MFLWMKNRNYQQQQPFHQHNVPLAVFAKPVMVLNKQPAYRQL
jgi:hypothetical protein